MTPTNELRFVEREEANYRTRTIETVIILQQKWVPENRHTGYRESDIEWRDVPVVEEKAND